MESNDIDSYLTDKELIEKAYWWIDQLIKSGGKDFVMHVPARLDHDTDLVLFNTAKRFENILKEYAALKAKCDRYEAALKEARTWIVEALTSEHPATIKCANDDLKLIDEAMSAGEGGKDEEKSAKLIDPISLVKYARENYKPSGEFWKDKFNIAQLSDEGIVNMFNHKEDYDAIRNQKEGKQ